MGQLNDENYRISKNNELLVRAVSDHQQRVQGKQTYDDAPTYLILLMA